MLISILIPCWNAERWIGQAIDSALAQTWQDKEVIVVDDGSSDGSLAVIKSYGDRLRFETGPNRGGNKNRNRLLEMANGEWIQYLDADDYLLPDKIAKQVDFLAIHADADVVFGNVTMEYWAPTEVRRELLEIPEPHDIWVLLARWYLPQTGAPLWRRSALVDVGGWKPDQPCCQEHELYLRLLMADKRFAYCPHNGAVYRQWSEHTVCKRSVPEVHRQRLAIKQRMQEFLGARDRLTHDRLHAINQARLEIARNAWQYNPSFACEIMAQVNASEPNFVPDSTPAAPRHYRVALRLFGFRAAEWLAAWSRYLFYRKVRLTFH